uniref:Uncharacterized protein n=1 Tax=Neobodo designis TaxID=312471 RepID=A0A7S1M4S6_NEODS
MLKSIRCMQRFVRRFLAGRVTSELRMLRAWAEAERAFKRRLEAHVSLPGDQVDRIVNKMLLKNCMTTEQWKRDVIRGMWEDRKSRYRRERQLAGVGDAALEAIQGKFSWMIPIDELVAVNQARLVDMLSTTEKGVFSHPNVQALFIDSVGEAEILKQAVAEARDMQLRKLNGRRVAAFGSSVERFTGRPEHSLDINVPLAGPLIPSWDPRNYTDRPGDLEDSPEASEAATSDVVSGGPTPEARIGRGGAMGASAEHLPAFSPATTPRAGALPAVKGATASSPKRTAKPPAASPRGGDSAAVKLPPISPRKRAK